MWMARKIQQSYTTTKEALLKCFDLPSKQQLYKVKFKEEG